MGGRILKVQEARVLGPIGENIPLFEMRVDTQTEVRLDLSKMSFITSIGVKNWINWTLKLPASSRLSLIDCPFVIINQINTVHGFLPAGSEVKSFHAPFGCEACGAEASVRLELGTHYDYVPVGHRHVLPEFPCPKCGEAMEPDFNPGRSLRFLERG